MGVVQKKKKLAHFCVFCLVACMYSFTCSVCGVLVSSEHQHNITEAYVNELSRLTGKTLRVGGLCCCAHFEPHASARFTKKNPAKLVQNQATTYWRSPSKRKSRAVNRSREWKPTRPRSTAERLRVAESRVQMLETEILALQTRITQLEQPLLFRLIPKFAVSGELLEADFTGQELALLHPYFSFCRLFRLKRVADTLFCQMLTGSPLL